MDSDAIDDLPAHEQFWVRAIPHLELLQELDFVPVISGDHNDDPAWSLWTDDIRQRVHFNQFKMPLRPVDDGGDPTGFLIVKSMLLTGFDAPVAQVLYLDRLIREAELLQAIARVNRTADGKDYGLVVDYYGVAAHLTEALAAYTSDDLEGTLRSLNDEIERLDSRHQRVRQLFVQRSMEPGPSGKAMEACVELLADEALRAQFDVDLKRFLNTLDVVLPRPEARPFIADAKLFADIQRSVRQRYRDQGDGGFDPPSTGPKCASSSMSTSPSSTSPRRSPRCASPTWTSRPRSKRCPRHGRKPPRWNTRPATTSAPISTKTRFVTRSSPNASTRSSTTRRTLGAARLRAAGLRHRGCRAPT